MIGTRIAPALLGLAVAAALGLPAPSPGRNLDVRDPAAQGQGFERRTYIVLFDDAPLASYRGGATEIGRAHV